ncbi:MAG: DUF2924 domain-containing protein [Methylocella sp.]
MTLFELRGEWRRPHRMPPPMRLSRDLLTRGIAYKLQERAYGGLATATARKLERACADPLGRGAAKPTQPISLKPGTRLVREWRGVTHTALIHADGSSGAVSATAAFPWSRERDRLSIVSKRREGAGGRLAGGQHFSRGALYLMLQNRLYRGDIVHQGTAYPASTRPSSIRSFGRSSRTSLRFIGRSVHWRWARRRRVCWPV